MIRSAFKFLAALIVFMAVAGASAFFTLSFFIQKEESVVVPDLSGKDAVSVLRLLSALELNAKVRGFEYDGQVPRDHVIHQSPEPGRTIKKGRDVSLVLSRGSLSVALPDLRGQSLSRARIILHENGLESGHTTFVYTRDADRDRILAQTPSPGQSAARSSTVDMLVSRGPRPAAYKMPDVAGRFLDETMLLIDDYKLFLDALIPVYDNSKPDNMILGQNPSAGHRVEEGDGVRLRVNRAEAEAGGGRGVEERLFTYRLAPGYLKQHVRLEMRVYGMNVTIYDELMGPGKEIWAIVPRYARAAVFLYVNDELVATDLYN